MLDLTMKSYSTSKVKLNFWRDLYCRWVQASQGKVQAIAKMPTPSCKKEVQSFIGMINYLSKFSARLSEVALPIRELAKNKVAFNSGPEHQAAFKLVKNEIVAAAILAYYDPKKTTVLQTDPGMGWAPACSKMKNWYILQAKP